jgi:site-specific recombinase XerD
MSKWIITPDKYLTEDEVRKIKKVCEEAALIARSRGNQFPVRDQLIIETALGTGLRVSELSYLKIADLHLKKGQNSLTVQNGKGGKIRVVMYSAKLKNLILEYLNYRTTLSEYLFSSERGAQITRSGLQQVFKKWAEKAGLSSHYSIHSLRHTYATNLYKASRYNLRMVQQQLGHSSPTTTSVYSAVINSDLEKALKQFDYDEE